MIPRYLQNNPNSPNYDNNIPVGYGYWEDDEEDLSNNQQQEIDEDYFDEGEDEKRQP